MSCFQLVAPLPPDVMDQLLALGYYRMRQTLFTTYYTITDEQQAIIVLWIRLRLDDYRPGRRHRELSRRNRRFSCTLHDAVVNDEIEALYARYAAGVDFDAPESVRGFMLGDSPVDHFPGRMWQVRDEGRLIAAGYFDEGNESCAGILNFYHPDYSKYSLSKWLYFEGVRYAAESGKKFFYPGYIALGYPKFDYKLEAGKQMAEVWDIAKGVWVPYGESVHAQPGKNSKGKIQKI